MTTVIDYTKTIGYKNLRENIQSHIKIGAVDLLLASDRDVKIVELVNEVSQWYIEAWSDGDPAWETTIRALLVVWAHDCLEQIHESLKPVLGAQTGGPTPTSPNLSRKDTKHVFLPKFRRIRKNYDPDPTPEPQPHKDEDWIGNYKGE